MAIGDSSGGRVCGLAHTKTAHCDLSLCWQALHAVELTPVPRIEFGHAPLVYPQSIRRVLGNGAVISPQVLVGGPLGERGAAFVKATPGGAGSQRAKPGRRRTGDAARLSLTKRDPCRSTKAAVRVAAAAAARILGGDRLGHPPSRPLRVA